MRQSVWASQQNLTVLNMVLLQRTVNAAFFYSTPAPLCLLQHLPQQINQIPLLEFKQSWQG